MWNRATESGPIKAGTLLLRETPFAYVLSAKEKGQRCDYCLERGKVMKCSVCQFVHYCGRSCQRDAWSEHKWECDNMKRVSPKVLPDAARLLAKIVCRLSKGNGNSKRSYYMPNSFRMWKDLMSHYSDLKVDVRRMEHFATLCAVLFEFFEDMSLPNSVELMGIYGRMCINSFTLLDVDMNSIGTAVYLGASILDHSCKPNAVATFDGCTICIRATEDIPTLDWGQVRISYIDVMKPAEERQAELLKTYYFLCRCDRCMDQYQTKLMHGAKCPNSQCDNPIQIPWKRDCQISKASLHAVKHESDGKQNGGLSQNGDTNQNGDPNQNGDSELVRCDECGCKVTDEQAEEFRKAMEFTELHLQNMNNVSTSFVDVCKHCLDRQQGILHPLNVMRAQTLDHAVDALIQMQLWDHACSLADDLLACFRNYYGERHPLTALLHLKYGKMLLYKSRRREALVQLKFARSIIAVTHGDGHPLFRRELLPLLQQAVMESD